MRYTTDICVFFFAKKFTLFISPSNKFNSRTYTVWHTDQQLMRGSDYHHKQCRWR